MRELHRQIDCNEGFTGATFSTCDCYYLPIYRIWSPRELFLMRVIIGVFLDLDLGLVPFLDLDLGLVPDLNVILG